MKKQQGFIAVTAVLITSALFLSLAVSVTSGALGATTKIVSIYQAKQASLLADACVAHALLRLTHELHYLGDQVLEFGVDHCEIFPIAEETDGTRTIHTQGTVKKHTYRVIVEVGGTSPELSIGSYTSVVTF